jgi:predicted kinase
VDVLHVEIDQINTARGLGLDGAPISAADWATTYAEAFRHVEQGLAMDRSVIFDATNFTRAQRDQVRHIGNRYGAETVILFVDVPAAEARRRWLANREIGQRYDVRDEDFANVMDHFEPPGEDEGVMVRHDGSRAIEAWIDHLCGGS